MEEGEKDQFRHLAKRVKTTIENFTSSSQDLTSEILDEMMGNGWISRIDDSDSCRGPIGCTGYIGPHTTGHTGPFC